MTIDGILTMQSTDNLETIDSREAKLLTQDIYSCNHVEYRFQARLLSPYVSRAAYLLESMLCREHRFPGNAQHGAGISYYKSISRYKK